MDEYQETVAKLLLICGDVNEDLSVVSGLFGGSRLVLERLALALSVHALHVHNFAAEGAEHLLDSGVFFSLLA